MQSHVQQRAISRHLRLCFTALGLLGGPFGGLLPGLLAQAVPALAPLPAQPAAPTQVSGYSVTGRVLCADTQRPARFAQVTLLPATDDNDGGGFGGRGRRLSARTDLDGRFQVTGVSPGDYYVVGGQTGYVNELAALETALNAANNPGSTPSSTTIPPGVPRIHVSAGGAAADLTLQRGSVIAGSVQWDDGSPAAGVQVTAQPATTASAGGGNNAGNGRFGLFGGFGPGGTFSGGQTDDRGRFRLSGLAPGAYQIRASVQAPVPVRGDDRATGRLLNVAVYAPDKMRRGDAATITLAAGEERDDVAVTMGLAGLHTVSGTVASPGTAVRSGSVNLTDQTDGTLNRNGTISSDGSFVVPYVPPGNYTLRVNASAQEANSGLRRNSDGGSPASTAPAVRFGPLQVSVTVADGDLTGLSINVTPVTTSQ